MIEELQEEIKSKSDDQNKLKYKNEELKHQVEKLKKEAGNDNS